MHKNTSKSFVHPAQVAASASPSKSLPSEGSNSSLGERRDSTEAAVHIQSPEVLLMVSGERGMVNMTCGEKRY